MDDNNQGRQKWLNRFKHLLRGVLPFVIIAAIPILGFYLLKITYEAPDPSTRQNSLEDNWKKIFIDKKKTGGSFHPWPVF